MQFASCFSSSVGHRPEHVYRILREQEAKLLCVLCWIGLTKCIFATLNLFRVPPHIQSGVDPTQ
jgi:hypothetical protein